MRNISHSEASVLLACQRKHAFAYTGALTDGACLEPISRPRAMSRGTVWGIGVAAFHEHGLLAGLRCIRDAARGTLGDSDGLDLELLDYARTAGRIHGFTAPELEIRCGFPVPGGGEGEYLGYCDGLALDAHDDYWIVEFKLRTRSATSFERVVLDRQCRWMAWGLRCAGITARGVIFCERVDGTAPGPVGLLKDGTPGARQSCTAGAYWGACAVAGVEPNAATLDRLRSASRHGVRHVYEFLPGEIDEAGREIESAWVQAARMDVPVGDPRYTHPVRSPGQHCGWCSYRDICVDPDGSPRHEFKRIEPKSKRGESDGN